MNNQVSLITRNVEYILRYLNKIELAAYTFYNPARTTTELQNIEIYNGSYKLEFFNHDLKIGGEDDNDENDEVLFRNLGTEFIKLAKKYYPDLEIVETVDSYKGYFDIYVKLKSDKKKKSQMNKIKKSEEKLNKLEADLIKFNNTVFTKIKQQTSSKKTCTNCKSNVSIAFIKSHKCPVCSSPLYSNTDTKRFSSITDRIKTAKIESKKIKEA